jgi:hypothetical protein
MREGFLRALPLLLGCRALDLARRHKRVHALAAGLERLR